MSCVPEQPWTGLPPAPGRLLLASPALREETFHRTVIYLVEHDEDGTVGLVLNRPTRTPVGQVLPDWQDAVCEPSVVFTGGPVMVDGALCLGRVSGDPAADGPGLRRVRGELATIDLDTDVALITARASQLRVFAGHSGWAAGQLAGELARGAWYVVEGQMADVFSDDPRPMWERVLRRQPPPLSLVSTYPSEPGLN